MSVDTPEVSAADWDGCAEIVDVGGASIVRLRGEIDLADADALRSCVADASAGGAEVVLDLSLVRFIDSAGIRAIIAAANAAEAAGRRVRLMAGPPNVDRVFAMLGLKERLDWMAADGPAAGAA